MMDSEESGGVHSVRDTPKFTEQEIAGFCSLLRGMPTFRQEDESITTVDLPELIKLMKWDRTEAQVAQYVDFWNTNFGGRMSLNLYCNILRKQHDRYNLLEEYAKSFDQDKNGFISREEFKYALDTLIAHDPTVTRVTYDKLLEQADENGDGKISVEELTRWLAKSEFD